MRVNFGYQFSFVFRLSFLKSLAIKYNATALQWCAVSCAERARKGPTSRRQRNTHPVTEKTLASLHPNYQHNRKQIFGFRWKKFAPKVFVLKAKENPWPVEGKRGFLCPPVAEVQIKGIPNKRRFLKNKVPQKKKKTKR